MDLRASKTSSFVFYSSNLKGHRVCSNREGSQRLPNSTLGIRKGVRRRVNTKGTVRLLGGAKKWLCANARESSRYEASDRSIRVYSELSRSSIVPLPISWRIDGNG